jgi:hypothetical protein
MCYGHAVFVVRRKIYHSSHFLRKNVQKVVITPIQNAIVRRATPRRSSNGSNNTKNRPASICITTTLSTNLILMRSIRNTMMSIEKRLRHGIGSTIKPWIGRPLMRMCGRICGIGETGWLNCLVESVGVVVITNTKRFFNFITSSHFLGKPMASRETVEKNLTQTSKNTQKNIGCYAPTVMLYKLLRIG